MLLHLGFGGAAGCRCFSRPRSRTHACGVRRQPEACPASASVSTFVLPPRRRHSAWPGTRRAAERAKDAKAESPRHMGDYAGSLAAPRPIVQRHTQQQQQSARSATPPCCAVLPAVSAALHLGTGTCDGATRDTPTRSPRARDASAASRSITLASARHAKRACSAASAGKHACTDARQRHLHEGAGTSGRLDEPQRQSSRGTAARRRRAQRRRCPGRAASTALAAACSSAERACAI